MDEVEFLGNSYTTRDLRSLILENLKWLWSRFILDTGKTGIGESQKTKEKVSTKHWNGVSGYSKGSKKELITYGTLKEGRPHESREPLLSSTPSTSVGGWSGVPSSRKIPSPFTYQILSWIHSYQGRWWKFSPLTNDRGPEEITIDALMTHEVNQVGSCIRPFVYPYVNQ